MSAFDTVRDVVKAETGLSDVTADSTFDHLGLDSLERAHMMIEIEDAFSIEIPNREAQRMSTVSDVVRYIEQHQ